MDTSSWSVCFVYNTRIVPEIMQKMSLQRVNKTWLFSSDWIMNQPLTLSHQFPLELKRIFCRLFMTTLSTCFPELSFAMACGIVGCLLFCWLLTNSFIFILIMEWCHVLKNQSIKLTLYMSWWEFREWQTLKELRKW